MGGSGKERTDGGGRERRGGREMRKGRALINWTFRGYSTGQVTATPVWLSNSVFTWLAQLARILCGASYHPCFVNTPVGWLIIKQFLLSSFKRPYREDSDGGKNCSTR